MSKPFVGGESVQQPADPGRLQRRVQASSVDGGQLLGGVTRQVPGIEPVGRRIGHRGQRGHTQAAITLTVLGHEKTVWSFE